jgi:hypothetical protein
VVGVKALKEQQPEGDQGTEESVVERTAFEGWQMEQGAAGQQLDKEVEQQGWTGAGRRVWIEGVFLDYLWYAYISICIHYMLYSSL